MDDEDLEQKIKRIRFTENLIKSEAKKKLDHERKKRKDQKHKKRSQEKEKRVESKNKKGNNDDTVIHESSSISKQSAMEAKQVSIKLNHLRESPESLPSEVIIQQQKAMISIAKELKSSLVSGSRLERRKAAFDKITKKSVEMLADTKLKAPKKKTVLEKMESNSTKSGPLKVLYDSVKEGYKIKVWIRRYNGLRGIISGYLVAFDFHMNLAMIDVCEIFTIETWMIGQPVQKRKKKTSESKKTIVHPYNHTDNPTVISNPKENMSVQKQTSTTIYLKSLAEKLKGGSKSALNIGKGTMDSKDLISSLNQKSAFIFDEKALSNTPSNNLSETNVAVKTNILKAPSEAVITLKNEDPCIPLKDFSPTIWSILQSVNHRENQNPHESEIAEKSVSDSSYSLVTSMLKLLQTRAEAAQGTEAVQKGISDSQTGDSMDLSHNQLKNNTLNESTDQSLKLPCRNPTECTASFPTLSSPLNLNSETSPLPPKLTSIPCNIFTIRQKLKTSGSTSFSKLTKDGKSTQEKYKMSNEDNNSEYSNSNKKSDLEYEDHQKCDKLVYEDTKNDFRLMLKETNQQTSQEPSIENNSILKSECLDSNLPINSRPCDPRAKNFSSSEISVSQILPELFISSPKMDSIPSLENKMSSQYFVSSFPNTSLTNLTDEKHLTKRKQTTSPSCKSKHGITSQLTSTVLSDSDDSASECIEILSQVCTITTFKQQAQSEDSNVASSRLKVSSNASSKVSSNVLSTGKLLSTPNVVLKHESSNFSLVSKHKLDSSNSVKVRKVIANKFNNKPMNDQNEEIKEEESSFVLNLSSNLYPNHSVSLKTKSSELNCNFIFHSIGKRLHEKEAKNRHHLEGKTINSSLIKISPWFEADSLKSQFSSSDDDLKENNYCEADSSVYNDITRNKEVRKINAKTLNHLNKYTLIDESRTRCTANEDFSDISLSLNSPFFPAEVRAIKHEKKPLPDNYSFDSLTMPEMSESLLITPVENAKSLAECNLDPEGLNSDSQYEHVPTVCSHLIKKDNTIGPKKLVLPDCLQYEENNFINPDSKPETHCIVNGNIEIIIELIESLLVKVCKNICDSETYAPNFNTDSNKQSNTSRCLNTFEDSSFPDFNPQTASVKENLESMMELKEHKKSDHQPLKLSVKDENYLLGENESEKAVRGDDVKNSSSSYNRVKFTCEKKGEPHILSNDKLQERKLKEDGEITDSESDYGALDKSSFWKIDEEKLKSNCKDKKTSKQKNGGSVSDGRSISDGRNISDERNVSDGKNISNMRSISDGRSISEDISEDTAIISPNRDELISDKSERHKLKSLVISHQHINKTKTNRDRDKEKLIELSDRESHRIHKSHRYESRQQDDKKSKGDSKKDESSHDKSKSNDRSSRDKSNASDSSNREKSKTSDSSSREKSKTSDSCSREKSKTSDSCSREKSKTSDSCSREKSKTSDRSSRDKSKTSDSSSRDKSTTSDSSSREKSKTSDSSSREKSKTSDRSSRDKSKTSDRSSREKSKRSDSCSREKSKTSDRSNREKSNISDSSSREESKANDRSSREKTKTSDSSSHEKLPSSKESLNREKIPFTGKISSQENLSTREKSSVHEKVHASEKSSVHEKVYASEKSSVHEKVHANEKSSVHEKLSRENSEIHKNHRDENSHHRDENSHHRSKKFNEKSKLESKDEKTTVREKSSDREKSLSREKIPFVPSRDSTNKVITESEKSSLVKNMKSPDSAFAAQPSEFRIVDEKCVKSLASKAKPDLNIFQQRNKEKSAQIKRKIDERDEIAANYSTSKVLSSITLPQKETKTNLKHSSEFPKRRFHHNHELQENTRTDQLLKSFQPFIPDKPKRGLIYKKRYVNQLFVRGDNIIMVACDKST